MRALVDSNVLVSALLARDKPGSALEILMRAGLRRRYVIVFPDEVADELLRVTSRKPHLRRRIRPAEAAFLVADLRQTAECPPRLEQAPPRVCRDPNDDYLVEHARRERVDVLVSGDFDLIALDGAGLPFRLLSPRTFPALLEVEGTDEE